MNRKSIKVPRIAIILFIISLVLRALLAAVVTESNVRPAFDEIGYEGYMAAEVSGGGLDYLTSKVSKPMDLIIAGK